MINVSIVGFGNIGKAVYEAVSQAPDMQLASIVSSKPQTIDIPVLKDISQLKEIDAAILCAPSRLTPDLATALLKEGISTIDSFDIHSAIGDLRKDLDPIAKENNAVAVISAGWDPGSDSVIRTLMEAMLPKGISYTNFGPGMSMGHTVAVKAIEGVKNALSLTIPIGTGLHRRMVYIELCDGADFAAVEKAIKTDAYFAQDETHVIAVADVNALKDTGHGVHLTRKGVSGITNNQNLSFSMSINNPALTAQILVSSTRAALRQQPGCYTLIEIPPIHFLYGEPDALVKRLV